MQHGTEQSTAQIEALQAQITQSEEEQRARAQQHAEMEKKLAHEKKVADRRLLGMQEKAKRQAAEQARNAQAEIDRTKAEAAAKEQELQQLKRQGKLSEAAIAAKEEDRLREARQAEERIAALQSQFRSAEVEVSSDSSSCTLSICCMAATAAAAWRLLLHDCDFDAVWRAVVSMVCCTAATD